MDGLILVRKPPNLTSHDVVDRIRGILEQKKVGHFGTLDPLATGLLLVAVGRATRFFPFFSKMDKTYRGKMRLGFSTDTYDRLGKPGPIKTTDYPTKGAVLEAMKRLTGIIDQTSPPYSAKKIKGKPFYALAREDKEVPLLKNRVTVYSFQLLRYAPPHIDFQIECSSGTYIRAQAHELGQDLHSGAHLTELERIEIGPFHVRSALSTERIHDLAVKGDDSFLLPLSHLLPELPKIVLTPGGVILARNGASITPSHIHEADETEAPDEPAVSGAEPIFRLFTPEGNLIALAKKKRESGQFHPFLVIDSA
jgi:tRNA pseudouridine55 synthase